MKKFVKVLCLFLSLIILLSACSINPIEDKIKSVVQLVFTVPNKQIIENDVLQTAVTMEEISEELKNLFPNIAEMCTDTAMKGLASPMGVHFIAAQEDIVVNVQSTDVKINSEENLTYIFTCTLVIERDEKNEIEVSGKIQVDDEGKISFIDCNDATFVLFDVMTRKIQ